MIQRNATVIVRIHIDTRAPLSGLLKLRYISALISLEQHRPSCTTTTFPKLQLTTPNATPFRRSIPCTLTLLCLTTLHGGGGGGGGGSSSSSCTSDSRHLIDTRTVEVDIFIYQAMD